MTDYVIKSGDGTPLRTVSIPASDDIATQLQGDETAEISAPMSPVRAPGQEEV